VSGRRPKPQANNSGGSAGKYQGPRVLNQTRIARSTHVLELRAQVQKNLTIRNVRASNDSDTTCRDSCEIIRLRLQPEYLELIDDTEAIEVAELSTTVRYGPARPQRWIAVKMYNKFSVCE
jgi:hypothetical protein